LPIKLSANGNIAAWQEASVGTESNGLRLAEVLVTVGDVVQPWPVALARFADDSVQADVAQARAGVAETAAQATEATANANRVRTLQNTGTFSGQQISQYLAAEQTALARVESAKAALAAQTAAPEEHPGAGAGRRHHLRAHRYRGRGRSQRHGTVPNDSPGTPRVARRGDRYGAGPHRCPARRSLSVTAANGAQLEGRVHTVAPTVDPLTRSGLVYVDLPPMQISSAVAKRQAWGRRPAPARPKQGTAPSGLSGVGSRCACAHRAARRDVASGIVSSAVREATSVGAIPDVCLGEFELGESKAP
jgi:hypothetical protein